MTSSTLADSYQPLMTKLVQESLVKLCVDNLPITDTSLQIDGIICISLGKDVTSQIVVKVHKFLEKDTWQGEFSDNRIGDSSSPWSLKRGGQDIVEIEDGPVDLTGAKQRSILQYTSENMPAGHISNTHGATTESTVLVNGPIPNRELTDERGSSATYKGPIPVPRVEEQNWTPAMLDKLSQLQPTNYKPLPHLKLKSPIKSAVVGSSLPDKSPKDLLCKICSEICYGGLSALQTHTQEKHRRYVCRFCYNTFSLRCNLKRHERLHVGVKPYNCKVCNKSFARSTDLKLHMHKHGMSETDVIVPCPRCPRSFLSVQNLRWHLYKVHKEADATYACTICEKLFIDKDEYMKHREEHTGENLPVHDSSLMELGPDDSLNGDSDNDQLYIDTQSEGTLDSGCIDDEIVLPKFDQPQSVDSYSSNSNEPSDAIAVPCPASDGSCETVKEIMAPVTSTPLPNAITSTNTTGSRKRKRGNPVKHVEEKAAEEDVDIDNMYYNSPLTKKQQARERPPTGEVVYKEGRSSRESTPLNFSEEPQDLSKKTTKEYRSVTPSPAMSPAFNLRQGVEPVALTKSLSSPHGLPAQGYINKPLSASWDSSTYKNLKGALTGATHGMSLPGHKTPEPLSTSGAFSPLTLPILITPTPENKIKNTPKSTPKSTPDNAKNTELNTSAFDDPNKEFQCSELGCNEVYLGFSAYEDHCMIRHGRYPCKYCRQTFSGKNNRTRHMRCHVGAKVYTCPDCFKNFSRPDSMREHQFIHTLSYQEDKCRNCGWAFDKKNLLLAHLKQCYRHKMETGKSTKLIDETPAYLNNDVDFKPLYPVKMESIPVSSVDGSTSSSKSQLTVPTVVPSGTDSPAHMVSNVVNSVFKHQSLATSEHHRLSSVANIISSSDAVATQKSLLAPNLVASANSILPLALIKQNAGNSSLSPKTSLSSSSTNSTTKRVSPLTISLNKAGRGVIDSKNSESTSTANLVVPNLHSLLPTPLLKPASEKSSSSSPRITPPPSDATESGVTNISNLVVPSVSSAFATSIVKRASPNSFGNDHASPIVIAPVSTSPIPMTSSQPVNGVPIVLSANAAVAAVTAVSTGNKSPSSRPLSPNVFNDKTTTTVPSIPAISSLTQVEDVCSATTTEKMAAGVGNSAMPSLISPSASKEPQAPLNSVLAAVKNLVKSRTSPTVVDQNANKTPSLQSNSEVD